MERLAYLNFTKTLDGARAIVTQGEDCWMASYPSLEDAIAFAFFSALLNSTEACEAIATELHMMMWKKPIYVRPSTLVALGFKKQQMIDNARSA